MSNLSYGEQMAVIASILQEEIDKLNSLPADEAKKLAREGLVKIGVCDINGQVLEPYCIKNSQIN